MSLPVTIHETFEPKELLHTPAGELAIMRTIKAAMDPQLILNPGKIFDL